MPTMDDAWAVFEKAVAFDEKRVAAEQSGDDKKAAIAGRMAEKKLDEAVEMEAQALAA